MKLKVAIMHKEYIPETRNYHVWVTKHVVEPSNDYFTVKKSSYLIPRPGDNIILLDRKWLLYKENSITSLVDDYTPAQLEPWELRAFLDTSSMRRILEEVERSAFSFTDSLADMLRSWFSKLTFKKEEIHTTVIGIDLNDARYYHDPHSGILGLQLSTIAKAERQGLTACPYCLSNEMPRKRHD